MSDVMSWLRGDLTSTGRIISAIAPAFLLGSYFLVGALIYLVRLPFRGHFQDAETQARGASALIGMGARQYFAWIMRPVWRTFERFQIPPNAVTTLSVLLAAAAGVSIAVGRFSLGGWLYLFAAIDDATRLGYARLNPDETAASALAFLEACARFYGGHGIRIERVLTDNGTCFKRRWAEGCMRRGIAVRKTRPYRPQTNGKAERFIRTLLELWAYAYPYEHERERTAALGPALESYNRFRRHRALGGLTPLQRVNNLSGTNN